MGRTVIASLFRKEVALLPDDTIKINERNCMVHRINGQSEAQGLIILNGRV
jgi:hypothetical protein